MHRYPRTPFAERFGLRSSLRGCDDGAAAIIQHHIMAYRLTPDFHASALRRKTQIIDDHCIIARRQISAAVDPWSQI